MQIFSISVIRAAQTKHTQNIKSFCGLENCTFTPHSHHPISRILILISDFAVTCRFTETEAQSESTNWIWRSEAFLSLFYPQQMREQDRLQTHAHLSFVFSNPPCPSVETTCPLLISLLYNYNPIYGFNLILFSQWPWDSQCLLEGKNCSK